MSILDTAYKPFSLPGYNYYKAIGEEMPEELNVRYMTIKEIKYFADLYQIDSFVDNILKSCIKEKIDIDKLLTGDRIYLFYMIRAMTIDTMYGFETICENCGHKLKAETDIFALPVKEFDSTLSVPIPLDLPVSKKKIYVVLPTREIEKDIEHESKKFKESFPNGSPDEVLYLLKRIVKNIDDVDDIDKFTFLETLHFKDWKSLDKQLSNVLPGLDLDLIVPCPNCKNDKQIVTMSIDPNLFFRLRD